MNKNTSFVCTLKIESKTQALTLHKPALPVFNFNDNGGLGVANRSISCNCDESQPETRHHSLLENAPLSSAVRSENTRRLKTKKKVFNVYNFYRFPAPIIDENVKTMVQITDEREAQINQNSTDEEKLRLTKTSSNECIEEEPWFPINDQTTYIKKIPFIAKDENKMAAWIDVKHIMFPRCTNQECTIVWSCLKQLLRYPMNLKSMYACTEIEQNLFLRQFKMVSLGCLLVSLEDVWKYSLELTARVEKRHKETSSSTCEFTDKQCSNCSGQITNIVRPKTAGMQKVRTSTPKRPQTANESITKPRGQSYKDLIRIPSLHRQPHHTTQYSKTHSATSLGPEVDDDDKEFPGLIEPKDPDILVSCSVLIRTFPQSYNALFYLATNQLTQSLNYVSLITCTANQAATFNYWTFRNGQSDNLNLVTSGSLLIKLTDFSLVTVGILPHTTRQSLLATCDWSHIINEEAKLAAKTPSLHNLKTGDKESNDKSGTHKAMDLLLHNKNYKGSNRGQQHNKESKKPEKNIEIGLTFVKRTTLTLFGNDLWIPPRLPRRNRIGKRESILEENPPAHSPSLQYQSYLSINASPTPRKSLVKKGSRSGHFKSPYLVKSYLIKQRQAKRLSQSAPYKGGVRMSNKAGMESGILLPEGVPAGKQISHKLGLMTKPFIANPPSVLRIDKASKITKSNLPDPKCPHKTDKFDVDSQSSSSSYQSNDSDEVAKSTSLEPKCPPTTDVDSQSSSTSHQSNYFADVAKSTSPDAKDPPANNKADTVGDAGIQSSSSSQRSKQTEPNLPYNNVALGKETTVGLADDKKACLHEMNNPFMAISVHSINSKQVDDADLEHPQTWEHDQQEIELPNCGGSCSYPITEKVKTDLKLSDDYIELDENGGIDDLTDSPVAYHDGAYSVDTRSCQGYAEMDDVISDQVPMMHHQSTLRDGVYYPTPPWKLYNLQLDDKHPYADMFKMYSVPPPTPSPTQIRNEIAVGAFSAGEYYDDCNLSSSSSMYTTSSSCSIPINYAHSEFYPAPEPSLQDTNKSLTMVLSTTNDTDRSTSQQRACKSPTNTLNTGDDEPSSDIDEMVASFKNLVQTQTKDLTSTDALLLRDLSKGNTMNNQSKDPLNGEGGVSVKMDDKPCVNVSDQQKDIQKAKDFVNVKEHIIDSSQPLSHTVTPNNKTACDPINTVRNQISSNEKTNEFRNIQFSKSVSAPNILNICGIKTYTGKTKIDNQAETKGHKPDSMKAGDSSPCLKTQVQSSEKKIAHIQIHSPIELKSSKCENHEIDSGGANNEDNTCKSTADHSSLESPKHSPENQPLRQSYDIIKHNTKIKPRPIQLQYDVDTSRSKGRSSQIYKRTMPGAVRKGSNVVSTGRIPNIHFNSKYLATLAKSTTQQEEEFDGMITISSPTKKQVVQESQAHPQIKPPRVCHPSVPRDISNGDDETISTTNGIQNGGKYGYSHKCQNTKKMPVLKYAHNDNCAAEGLKLLEFIPSEARRNGSYLIPRHSIEINPTSPRFSNVESQCTTFHINDSINNPLNDRKEELAQISQKWTEASNYLSNNRSESKDNISDIQHESPREGPKFRHEMIGKGLLGTNKATTTKTPSQNTNTSQTRSNIVNVVFQYHHNTTRRSTCLRDTSFRPKVIRGPTKERGKKPDAEVQHHIMADKGRKLRICIDLMGAADDGDQFPKSSEVKKLSQKTGVASSM